MSIPTFRFFTTEVSAIESISKTPVALGYSPSLGGSPVIISRLRNPSTWAPRISDCIPIRLRSLQQKCTMVSMPVVCSILTAVAIGLSRELARGPSGKFIALMPACSQSLAFSRVLPMSAPRGGVSSIVVTFFPLVSLWPRRDFSANGFGSSGCILAAVFFGEILILAATLLAALSSPPTARTISLMCFGVVPQHPLIILAPFSNNFLAYSAMYSGVHI